MGNDYFVAKKRSSWGSVIKAILIIAALAFVAYKIYNKFFKQKLQQEVLDEDESAEGAIAEASESEFDEE